MNDTIECKVRVYKWGPLGFASFTTEIGISGRFLIFGPWLVRLP